MDTEAERKKKRKQGDRKKEESKYGKKENK
jgi:hypothetical protein